MKLFTILLHLAHGQSIMAKQVINIKPEVQDLDASDQLTHGWNEPSFSAFAQADEKKPQVSLLQGDTNFGYEASSEGPFDIEYDKGRGAKPSFKKQKAETSVNKANRNTMSKSSKQGKSEQTCDDNNSCTIDSYDKNIQKCVHTPISCNEGEVCYPADGRCVAPIFLTSCPGSNLVQLTQLPISCDSSDEILLTLPTGQTKLFTKTFTTGNFRGEASDGSVFSFIRDEDDKIFGSLVDATEKTVTQFYLDSNGNPIVTVLSNSDFPPEADDYLNENRRTQESLGTNDNFINVEEPSDITLNVAASSNVLSLLAVWTPNAECKASGLKNNCIRTKQTMANMQANLKQAVSTTNDAFALSGVRLTINLVHSEMVQYTESTAKNAIEVLHNPNDGVIDHVHNLRSTYEAELVTMIVGEIDYCGMARTRTRTRIDTTYTPRDIPNMFSIVEWKCAVSSPYSLAHEIGHTFLCQHDRGTENMCKDQSKTNYGFRDGSAGFRTIMAYKCNSTDCDNTLDGCSRIQYFSTPNVQWKKITVGDSRNDNVKQINSVLANVARFFKESPRWYKKIAGRDCGDPYVSIKAPTRPKGYVSNRCSCTSEHKIAITAIAIGNGFDEDLNGTPNQLLLNKGGKFEARVLPGSGEVDNTESVDVGDVNKDGLVDIIIGNANGRNLLLTTKGDFEEFDTSVLSENDLNAKPIVKFAHMNSDQDLDIIITSRSFVYWPSIVLFNDGTGDFSSVVELTEEEFGNITNWVNAFAVDDVNGDLKNDLLLGAFDGNAFSSLLLNQGGGRFTKSNSNPQLPTIGPDDDPDMGVESLEIVDVNGDKQKDIVALGKNSSTDDYRFIRVLLSNGDGTFGDPHDFFGLNSDSTVMTVGDVDNDGDVDILIGGESILQLYLNDGLGMFKEKQPSPLQGEGQKISDLALFDIDHDGYLDIIVGRKGLSNLILWNNCGLPFSKETLPGDTEYTTSLAIIP